MIKKAGIIAEIDQNVDVTSLTGFVSYDRAKDGNPGDMIFLFIPFITGVKLQCFIKTRKCIVKLI